MRRKQPTYSGFPWNTGRDDNDIGPSERFLEAVICGKISFDLCGSGNVRQIGGHSWNIDDIIKAELCEM